MQFDREKGVCKEIIFFCGHLEEGSMEVFMKRDVAHEVAFIGVMTALMAVVLTLETYVFIYFIKPSPAFLSIPLFIALSMYGDWKHSFIGGTIFGCCSFVLSFVVGYTVFYNPLISILPRTLAGVAGYWILHGLTAVTKKRGKDTVRAIAAALTVILHTVLVLGAMEIFSSGGAFFDTVWQTIIGINFLSEITCAIFLTPILLRVMKKYTKTPDFIPLKKVKMKSEVTMNNNADDKSEAEL